MTVVHLVRHTAVARTWSGRCYGQGDVPLSREGRGAARALATEIAKLGARRLHVSPLRRARFLAGLVAREAGTVELVIDSRLAECYFGAWEGCTWDAIYTESGDAMMGLVTAPDAFRPGGDGETPGGERNHRPGGRLRIRSKNHGRQTLHQHDEQGDADGWIRRDL